jgi:hypothetical protein
MNCRGRGINARPSELALYGPSPAYMEMPGSSVGHIHMYTHAQFTVCDTRPLSSLAERHPNKTCLLPPDRRPPASPEESLFMPPPRPGRFAGFLAFCLSRIEKNFLPCCRLCATTHVCMEPLKAAQKPTLVSRFTAL